MFAIAAFQRGVLAAAVAVLLGALVAVAAPVAPARADFSPSFPKVGELHYTDCAPTCATGKALGYFPVTQHFVDVERRTLYAYQAVQRTTFPRGIAVVDVDTMKQTRWIDLSGSKLPSDKFGVATLDTASQRLIVGEQSAVLGCDSGSGELPCGNPGRIAVIDLTQAAPIPVVFRLPAVPAVTVQPVPETSVGDAVTGLTFDADRNRLYVLTSSGQTFEVGGTDPRPVSVVAYDSTALSDTAAPLWTYRLRSCGNALPQRNRSAYFDVTEDGGTLYFACRGVSGYTLPHGVVRLHLHESPSTADPTAGFEAEFVPFGGDLTQGFATGDPANDRVGIGVAGASGQRMYIYDARHGSWVASMLMGDANVGGAGADPASGRFYVLNEPSGVRTVDAAALPAILSQMISLDHNPGVAKDPVIDPVTRRMFEPGPSFPAVGAGGIRFAHLWVFEDQTEPYSPPPREDPDLQTHDIDEALALQVSHTGYGSAYGSRAMWVGGTTAIPFIGGMNQAIPSQFESLKLSGGDRGLYLAEVGRAELSGESDRGEAAAEAVAARMDDATADDIEAKYGQITGPFGIGGEDAAPCNDASPSSDCLSFKELSGRVGQMQESRCNDFGGSDDRVADEHSGSTTSCTRLDTVRATASGSAAPPTTQGPVTFSVGDSQSLVDVKKLPEGGIETVSTAFARDIAISVTGLGRLSIGEITSTATTSAAGRVGTATSEFLSSAKNVRVIDATGATVFSCGVPGVDAKSGQGEQCGPAQIAFAVNRHFAPHVVASAPRPDLDPKVMNSPGGARATVTKDPYAFWNDFNVNGDSRREVVGLDLTVYSDTNEASRVKLQFAAVYSEAQYRIGSERPPVVEDPTKLTIGLVDEDIEPLAGGAFQVRKASTDPALPGELVAACLTTDDGVGNCEFDNLAPGDYSLSQLAAPVGYSPVGETTVPVAPGMHTEVIFTNLRSVGEITVTLATEDTTPLAGATFEVHADNGDLLLSAGDQSVADCTTGLDGRCTFEEVPLGRYVVHQSVAPPGYLKADDAAFELTQPGQVAELSFVTGLEGIDGSGSVDTPAPIETARVAEPTDSTEVVLITNTVVSDPEIRTMPLIRPSIRDRFLRLPAEVAQFIRRKPGQAILFGLLWLLLASPLYLATRRRSLTLAKVAV